MPLRRPVLACALLRCLGAAVLAGGAAPAASAQDLTVSAAASLAGAMREIAAAFAAAHPGAKVNLNLAGSNALLAQIAQGAPVDVFASADPQTMDRAADRKLIAPATRRNFAGNRLVLVVPSVAASPPVALADLARPAVRRIAIGSPASVPAGRYAQTVLAGAGLWQVLQPKLVFAEDVRQVLNYVERGEADAGFVYRTDALGAGAGVRTVLALPGAGPVRYPIAVVAGSARAAAAAGFVGFVSGASGQAILARHGFEPP